MTGTQPVDRPFREGDEVMLAQGTYQGTRGIFVRLREDAGWADITERNGNIRNHPVSWLAHFVEPEPAIRKAPTDSNSGD